MLNSTCVFILKGEYLELSEDKDNERHMELLAEFDRRKRVMHLPSAYPWGDPGLGRGLCEEPCWKLSISPSHMGQHCWKLLISPSHMGADNNLWRYFIPALWLWPNLVLQIKDISNIDVLIDCQKNNWNWKNNWCLVDIETWYKDL